MKPLSDISKVDARNSCYVVIDRVTGNQRSLILEDHYSQVAQFELHSMVPHKIASQYEIARNIYVYAWYVYEFFNVAEAKVLTVLELALKDRIGNKELKKYIQNRKQQYFDQTGKKLGIRQGLKTLMEYSRDNKLVANKGFSAWRRYATRQAYCAAQREQWEWAEAEMARTGKDEIELPIIEVEQLPPDENYDHVQFLIDHTNKIRNTYAHGTAMLHDQVLGSFEMVSEFINQLYQDRE